ncbi:MAG: hypothetical protein GF398_02875 [Chitinivibrionales bacterium]|nr:hypothetical protein [Chitinivibrionales bacterium]
MERRAGMRISVSVTINASKEDVWNVITGIEQSAETISGIEKIEILEKPESGLVGLKWRETRTLFGKTATEVMWITDAAEPQYYQTRAESHGSVYQSKLSIAQQDNGVGLSMDFNGTPQTFGARLMYALMGFMFKGATEKALKRDLDDIKAAVEKSKSVSG